MHNAQIGQRDNSDSICQNNATMRLAKTFDFHRLLNMQQTTNQNNFFFHLEAGICNSQIWIKAKN